MDLIIIRVRFKGYTLGIKDILMREIEITRKIR